MESVEARKCNVNDLLCAVCGTNVNDSTFLGVKYSMKELVLHYFCVLLADTQEQRGNDDEGLHGFLYEDIKKEINKASRRKCHYCRQKGAATSCCKCRIAFHLTCGLLNNSQSVFKDKFNTYCQEHRKKQIIPLNYRKEAIDNPPICVICHEVVEIKKVPGEPDPLFLNLWAPCCKKTWFHRVCIQKLAISAGSLFKCPVCSNTTKFIRWMMNFGLYIPERDASWEEEGAFDNLLERYSRCDMENCVCPYGRLEDREGSLYEILVCDTCGSQGTHIICSKLSFNATSWECQDCKAISNPADVTLPAVPEVDTAVAGSSAGASCSSATESSLSVAPEVKNTRNTARKRTARRPITTGETSFAVGSPPPSTHDSAPNGTERRVNTARKRTGKRKINQPTTATEISRQETATSLSTELVTETSQPGPSQTYDEEEPPSKRKPTVTSPPTNIEVSINNAEGPSTESCDSDVEIIEPDEPPRAAPSPVALVEHQPVAEKTEKSPEKTDTSPNVGNAAVALPYAQDGVYAVIRGIAYKADLQVGKISITVPPVFTSLTQAKSDEIPGNSLMYSMLEMSSSKMHQNSLFSAIPFPSPSGNLFQSKEESTEHAASSPAATLSHCTKSFATPTSGTTASMSPQVAGPSQMVYMVPSNMVDVNKAYWQNAVIVNGQENANFVQQPEMPPQYYANQPISSKPASGKDETPAKRKNKKSKSKIVDDEIEILSEKIVSPKESKRVEKSSVKPQASTSSAVLIENKSQTTTKDETDEKPMPTSAGVLLKDVPKQSLPVKKRDRGTSVGVESISQPAPQPIQPAPQPPQPVPSNEVIQID